MTYSGLMVLCKIFPYRFQNKSDVFPLYGHCFLRRQESNTGNFQFITGFQFFTLNFMIYPKK